MNSLSEYLRIHFNIVILYFTCTVIPLASTARNNQSCAQCATPALEANWFATGLQTYPKELSFFDDCITTTVPDTNATCTGHCFEMTFPLNGKQQMVRGCDNAFFGDHKQNLADNCEFFIGNGSTVIGGFTVETPVSGFRTCRPEILQATNKPCNLRFYVENVAGLSGPLAADRESLKFCTKENVAGASTCIDCYQFGSFGSCTRSVTTTCQTGSYCAKIDAKLGLNHIEYRGCIPISPYAISSSSMCTKIDSKMTIPVLMGQTSEETMTGELCICNDRQNCNSSYPVIYSIPLLWFVVALCYSYL